MNNIRELRIEKALTQTQLVKICNVPGFDEPMLSKIENGRIMPTKEIEEALMSALQAARSELYGEWKEIPLRGVGVRKRKTDGIPDNDWEAKELVETLKYGKANAIKRWELRVEMGLGDRRLRKVIERTQGYGILIANNSDGDGYYLVGTPEEAEAYYRQELSRFANGLNKIEPFREYLVENGVDV